MSDKPVNTDPKAPAKPRDQQHVTDASHTPSVPDELGELPDEGITPQRPGSMPRAEDDAKTAAKSPEFHDDPNPGHPRR